MGEYVFDFYDTIFVSLHNIFYFVYGKVVENAETIGGPFRHSNGFQTLA